VREEEDDDDDDVNKTTKRIKQCENERKDEK
jgi:hypothetical protein